MTGQVLTYREALRAGIEQALADDERVFLMGEDVGRYGGCYGVSKGLFERYGTCLLYTSPSPRDQRGSRMPSSA